MHGANFDRYSRRLARRMTRRQAAAAIGGGIVFGAVPYQASTTHAQSDVACRIDLLATVRLGESAGTLLGGDIPGEIAGALQFPGDSFSGATFLRTDNEVLTVSGEIIGAATTIRIVDRTGNVIVLVGAAEQPIEACTGRVDGLFTGPLPGDMGDWHGTLSTQGEADASLVAGASSAPEGASAPAAGSVCAAATERCSAAENILCCAGLGCYGPDAVNTVCLAPQGGACTIDQGCLGNDGPSQITCKSGICTSPVIPGGLCQLTEECAGSATGDYLCIDGICQTAPAPSEPAPCAQTGADCSSAECCVGYCTQDLVCECVGTGGICAGIGTGGCCDGQPCANGICP